MASAKAFINDTIIADSDETIKVEGNHYFPRSSVNMDLFSRTDLETVCPWKGSANYFTLNVDDQEYKNAAWTYEETVSERAKPIEEYIAFYPNIVTVEDK